MHDIDQCDVIFSNMTTDVYTLTVTHNQNQQSNDYHFESVYAMLIINNIMTVCILYTKNNIKAQLSPTTPCQ